MSFLLGKAKRAAIWMGGAALVSFLALLSWHPFAASATLLDDPVRTVTSTVSAQLPSAPAVSPTPTVRTTVSSVTSSVPQVTQAPSTPALPDPPQVQIPPPPKVELPPVKIEAAPKPSAQVAAPSVGSTSDGASHTARSADGGSAGKAVDTVTEKAGPVAEVAASADGQKAASGHRAGAVSGGPGPAGGAPSPRGNPLERAREAPIRHWLARVWPAIALGPFADLLPELQTKLTGATALLPADVSRMMSGFGEGSGAATPPPPERSATPSSPSAEHHVAPLPVGGEISIIVLLLAAASLTALLVFAVRQELGPMHRWPQ